MPKCIILVGPTLAGKSTWTEKNSKGFTVISCDIIRHSLYGKSYKHTSVREEIVWTRFGNLLKAAVSCGANIIIDNTNLREHYINRIKESLTSDYKVEYVYFDVPWWKLHFRNIKRYLQTKRWIPIKVVNYMYKNFKKLKKNGHVLYK